MILYIKYMVSLRCKMKVKEELKKLGIRYLSVELGWAKVAHDLTPALYEQLKENLLDSGLEIMDDKRSILIERVKNLVIEMVLSNELPKTSYSEYISSKLNYDYTYLSNMFSEVCGITLQQYIINNKIERVKELLLYEDQNLTQIAYTLHYSSVAHLSHQFKKVTGLTPSYYKKLKMKKRRALETLQMPHDNENENENTSQTPE